MIYNTLAHVYDCMMDHVPYREWASYLRRISGRHYPDPRKILDAACGTGRFLDEFIRQHPTKCADVSLSGFDQSEGMLAVARERLAAMPVRTSLSVGNLQSWNEDGQFELIVCLYDSINYLLNEKQLARAFANFHRLLVPGGVCVFDICTERNSVAFLDGYEEEGKAAGWHYIRRSWYDGDDRIHHNNFSLTHIPTGRQLFERHQQRIYRIREIEDLLADSPLDYIRAHDGMTFNRPNPKSLRVHFVTQRNK